MTDNSLINNFHFLRPWLLAGIPLALLFFFALRQRFSGQSSWSSVIDPRLLQHLINKPETSTKQPWPLVIISIAWVIACLAMAGPAWERAQQPVLKNQNALVIILDLSLSMYAEDQKPSRLVNAKRKIADILASRKDGLTALVVYSGDAHIVAPLTDDSETIATLLPALEPDMMPKFGSNLASAIAETGKLFANSGTKQADVILLTDEILPSQFALLDSLGEQNLHLALLTFGTASGAPIPLEQGFLKDPASGNTILARLNKDEISAFAQDHGLLAIPSSVDDHDIQQLLANMSGIETRNNSERQFDLWQDHGHWLTILLLPLALLFFRRGWILVLLVMVLPDNSYALDWADLWQTRDQQAATAFQQGDMAKAAATFADPQWQASSQYKNGQYEEALKGFAKDNSATGLYNQGNALAKTGQLEKAAAAYGEALKKQPDFADAAANKAIVEEAIKQQKQQQKEQQNKKDQQDQQDQQDQKESGQQDSASKDAQQKNGESPAEQDPSQQQASDANTDKDAQGQQASGKEKDKEKQPAQPDTGKPEDTQAASENKEKPDEEEKANNAAQQAQASELTPLEKEQQQALQQWLRKIPDDPGQLLRNKFRYQYQNNRNNNEHIDKNSEQLW